MRPNKLRRFNRDRFGRLRAYLVNRIPEQPAQPAVTVQQLVAASAADGWLRPRKSDKPFDVGVRLASLAPSTTSDQVLFQANDTLRGGIIRNYGYGYNQPHGFLQVRTSILINGAPPTDYLFRAVDPVSGSYAGSFPPFQVGSILEPAECWIKLPQQAVVTVRFVNNSTKEYFSCAVRLTGWFYGGD